MKGLDVKELVNTAAARGWTLDDEPKPAPPPAAPLKRRADPKRLLGLLLAADVGEVAGLGAILDRMVADARVGLGAARRERFARFLAGHAAEGQVVSKGAVCRAARVQRSDLRRYLSGTHLPGSVICARLENVLAGLVLLDTGKTFTTGRNASLSCLHKTRSVR